MIEQVKIVKVFVSDKNKDKVEFKTKKGEKFWKVGIKTDKHGDDWFSALAFREDDRVMKLQEGDEVTIETEENNGFKNFKLPSRLDLLEVRVRELEARMGIADIVVEHPKDEVASADIPF